MLYQLRGKQKRNGRGIWYSSGIWSTVWLESVPQTYIQSVKNLANMYDELKTEATIGGLRQKIQLQIIVLDNGVVVAKKKGICDSVLLSVKNAKFWSPSSPILYDLKIDFIYDYIKVVGEFGGHGWAVREHLWDNTLRNWGYGRLSKSQEEYIERYVKSSNIMGELRKKGISAGVYTQTTDVEGEINGLIT